MIRMEPALAEAGLSARMLLQVHDELVFEAPEAEVDKTMEVAQGVMEKAPRAGAPPFTSRSSRCQRGRQLGSRALRCALPPLPLGRGLHARRAQRGERREG